jgi:hypothetical protein
MLILPVIEARLTKRSNGVDISEKYHNILQWVLGVSASSFSIQRGDDPGHQAHHLLHLTFAVSNVSGVPVKHGLF